MFCPLFHLLRAFHEAPYYPRSPYALKNLDQIILDKTVCVFAPGRKFCTISRLNQILSSQRGYSHMLHRLFFVAVVSLFSVTVANADPLVLTSGSFGTFRSPNFGTNSGAASGPRVSFSGGFTNFDCGIFGCGVGVAGLAGKYKLRRSSRRKLGDAVP